MARSDKITIEQKKVEYYSDFLNNFDKNPRTGFLARVTNEESVKQALKNLILTNRGERFQNPMFGSTVRASLFNPMDATTIIAIKESVTEAINMFEPRVELRDVIVIPYENDNHILIKIVFSIRNYISEDFTLDLIVSRVR